jgi:predicted PurR-regulated permease PerM
MSDNLLRPVLVGQHMEAHPMLLFFGILGGILLFGFSGIILGPVVVAFLSVSARLFRREFAHERALRTQTTPPG